MLKNHSGVLICPNISQSTDALTNEIISSFQASCEKIHELFLPKQVCLNTEDDKHERELDFNMSKIRFFKIFFIM